ncbi:hypothetical protein [Bradyrhizobium sp. WSM1743]|uniref:hypothetical protein n=1 Tax=Bradyrhizobium sp. WSM1743 TaxID=318996 RepID=UPI0003F952C7|nr:hypothetical protein [Bradyrhizobium sp. WSM1743]
MAQSSKIGAVVRPLANFSSAIGKCPRLLHRSLTRPDNPGSFGSIEMKGVS